MGIVLGNIVLINFIIVAARWEVGPRLTARIAWVKIDGTEMPDANALVGALRAMHTTIGHHSHPTRNFSVVLNTERGYLTLDLRRDSDDPHEYWIFYSGFSATRANGLGHAFTDTLDAY